jgi:hypothetical protein
MLIKNLFEKDIERPLNGVIKADQTDNESAWQELDEYVVTRELDTHFRDFFGAYLNAINNPKNADVSSRIGVWVSGFFGSGKSHFIKMLSYLLQNRVVTYKGQTKRAIEFFESKIVDASLFGDIKRAVGTGADAVLFNVDSKANHQKDGRNAILGVFLRVFNEMQGFSGDHPHIAQMERYLKSQNKLEAFHDAFLAAKGNAWVQERDAYEFNQDEMIQALSEALGQSEDASKRSLERAERDFPLTPENFAKWVKEYLDSRGPEHRILFIADEIGQFIGTDTHLMLSLQTITEDLGTACGGRAWVVVTSQENIEAVLGEVKASKANDFSKIQGRFKTRLSLSSANTDEVIQARLLSKTPQAKGELAAQWVTKGDILKNQLSFTNVGMTFKRLDSNAKFVANYPFVPYQFQLVQKVFEDIRKHGATGLHLSRGERSMLDAFQLAAQQVADKPVGALVPLYRFYPSIESFLDTGIRRTIDQAKDRNLDAFDIEVLRLLFLIRYVDEVRANVDNLVTLCIDEIDADRLALRRRIEESLQRLERETLISRNGEDYFFLTNEERDITREIKDVELGSGDQVKKLGELIFDGVLKGNNKYRYSVNKKDFGFNRDCDNYPIGQIQTAHDLVVSVISPLDDAYEMYNESRCIMDSSTHNGKVLIKLGNDDALGRELSMFLKTEKYIKRKNDDTLPPTTKRILSDRAEENRQREARLVKLLEEMLTDADYYVAGQTRPIHEASATAILFTQLSYLIENTFPKLGYLKVLRDSDDTRRSEIQAVLRANDVGQQSLEIQADHANARAIDDVRNFVSLSSTANRQVVLNDLVEKFAKRPYGWPDFETALIVARLLVVGEITLVADGGVVASEKAYEILTKNSKWRSAVLLKRKTVDTARLQEARKIGLDLFAQMGPDAEEELFGFLCGHLTDWQAHLREYQALAKTGRYPGGAEIGASLKTIAPLLGEHNSFEFFEKFIAARNDLNDLLADYHDLQDFYENQKTVWERLRDALDGFAVNSGELEKDQVASAALGQMRTILNASSPYGLLKTVDGLIQQVQTVNTELVTERRTRTLEKIDAHITEVEREVERTEANGDLSHGCLAPLQALRKRALTEMGIGNLKLVADDAVEDADRAIVRLEHAVQEKQAARVHNAAFVKENSPTAKAAPTIKPSRTVKPLELMTKTYLETEEDVQEFVDALSAQLRSAIAENARVRIR